MKELTCNVALERKATILASWLRIAIIPTYESIKHESDEPRILAKASHAHSMVKSLQDEFMQERLPS